MFDFLLPNKKDLDALFRALAANPLLAALLLISPLEAFKFLNIVPKFLGALLPATGEDAQLAQSRRERSHHGLGGRDCNSNAGNLVQPRAWIRWNS